LDELKEAVKIFYKIPVDVKEVSVKGWNWGKTEFQGKSPNQTTTVKRVIDPLLL
jgi:structure-specific recognition protein 1